MTQRKRDKQVVDLEAALRESQNQIESLTLSSQRTTHKIKQAHNSAIEQMEVRCFFLARPTLLFLGLVLLRHAGAQTTLGQKNSTVTSLTTKVQEMNLQIRGLTEERQELKQLLIERQVISAIAVQQYRDCATTNLTLCSLLAALGAH